MKRLVVPLPKPSKPIACRCVLCGTEYEESDWYHDSDALMMCMTCEYRDGFMRFHGIRGRWFYTYDAGNRPLAKKVSQLSAAIKALEREVCCGNRT